MFLDGITLEKVLAWVDLRVEEWIRDKTKWGTDLYTNDQLKALAKQLPIYVYDDYFVPGRDPADRLNGYHLDDTRIEIALYIPPPYPLVDPNQPALYRGCFLYGNIGLYSLPHELTHTALGHFHANPVGW